MTTTTRVPCPDCGQPQTLTKHRKIRSRYRDRKTRSERCPASGYRLDELINPRQFTIEYTE